MTRHRIRSILLYWDVAALVLTTLSILATFELLVKPILAETGTERTRNRFRDAESRFAAGIRFLEERPYLPYGENLDLILDSLGRSVAASLPYDRSIVRLEADGREARTIRRSGGAVEGTVEGIDTDADPEGPDPSEALGAGPRLVRFRISGQPYVGIAGWLPDPAERPASAGTADRARVRLWIADHESDFYHRIHRARAAFLTILGSILIALLLVRLSTTRTVTREIRQIEDRIRREGDAVRTRGLVGTELTGLDLAFRDTEDLYSSFIDLNGRLTDVGEIIGGIADPDLFKAVLKGDRSILEPHEEWMAVLFLDIQGFTTIAERRKGDAMRIVNRIWRTVEEIVDARGGKINKFIGDAALLIFPAGPERSAAAASAALESGIRLLGSVPGLERELDVEFNFRVGVDCGIVVYGKTGSDRNYELGVIGDPVNTAARLEALNKPYGTNILFTDRVAAEAGIGPRARFRPTGEESLLPFRMDRARPKGKTEARDLFSLVRVAADTGRFPGSGTAYPRAAFARYAKLSRACSAGIAAWRDGDGSKGPRLWAALAREAGRLDSEFRFPGARTLLSRLVTSREFLQYKASPDSWNERTRIEVARPAPSWLEYGAVELDK